MMEEFNERGMKTEGVKNKKFIAVLIVAFFVGAVNVVLCSLVSERIYLLYLLFPYAALAVLGGLRAYFNYFFCKLEIRWFAIWHLKDKTNLEPSELRLRVGKIIACCEVVLALLLSLICLFFCV